MWLHGDLGGMGGGRGGGVIFFIIIHKVEVPYKYVILCQTCNFNPMMIGHGIKIREKRLAGWMTKLYDF